MLPVSHACVWKCAGPSLPSPLTLITSSRVSRLTGCSPCPHPRVQPFTLHPPRMPSWHLKLHTSTAHHLSPKMSHRWRPHPSSGQAPNLASGLDPSLSRTVRIHSMEKSYCPCLQNMLESDHFSPPPLHPSEPPSSLTWIIASSLGALPCFSLF